MSKSKSRSCYVGLKLNKKEPNKKVEPKKPEPELVVCPDRLFCSPQHCAAKYPHKKDEHCRGPRFCSHYGKDRGECVPVSQLKPKEPETESVVCSESLVCKSPCAERHPHPKASWCLPRTCRITDRIMNCIPVSKLKKPTNPREHYHHMLDQAMDQTHEGDSFLPRFTQLLLDELREKIR